MLVKTTIARPYAKAVFEQAQAEGNMEMWSALLKMLSHIVQDPQMRHLLHSPKVSHKQLLDLLSGINGGKLSDSAANFIRVLIKSNRLKIAGQISELFEQKRSQAEGKLEVNVVSAFELDSEQSKRIAEAMGKRTGKKVNISAVVDKSLIGGMIVRAGDSVIDASLRGRLTKLRNELFG